MPRTFVAYARENVAMAKAAKTKSQALEVPAPNLQIMTLTIRGTAPYCQNKFSQKAIQMLIEQQEAGSTSKSTKKREPKDFDKLCEGAKHISTEGWCGIPCAAIRSALISACRTTGTVMTRAKLAIVCEPEGFDAETGEPLARITKGKPKRKDAAVRNASGVIDIRPRPVWDPGWEARINLKFDADMIAAADVYNLLMRAGIHVGLGEGRHDSKNSNGIGYGTFQITGKEVSASDITGEFAASELSGTKKRTAKAKRKTASNSAA